MSNHKPAHQPPDPTASPDALVLPLDTLNRTLLPLVGGKAAQLGTLIGAGFAVPTGFCVTTNAYARVAASAELDPPLGVLSTVLPTDTPRLAELARKLADPTPKTVETVRAELTRLAQG